MEELIGRAIDIADLHVEVREVDDLIWGHNERVRVFGKDNLPEYVNCSNPICHGGGISISEIIRNVIQERKEDDEVRKKCPGYEGSPKGRRKYKSCVHTFKVKVHIKYANI
jgi:hypothetical protein